jgi:hypothetical protein
MVATRGDSPVEVGAFAAEARAPRLGAGAMFNMKAKERRQ